MRKSDKPKKRVGKKRPYSVTVTSTTKRTSGKKPRRKKGY